MNWFKFYGQDFLTDMKISQLTIAEKLMWVTILCLAHSEGQGGLIAYCNEALLKIKMGLRDTDAEWKELDGFLEVFERLSMIEKTENGIRVKNFAKRQEMQFTPAEKQERYRERQKKVTNVTEPKVTSVTIDKKRIEKNIYPTPAGLELLTNYNLIFKKELKSTVSWEKNLAEWLNVYSVSDMVRALEVAKKDQFWKDKMSPEMLLRRKNPRGEDCDRIGELLSKEKKPNLSTTETHFEPYNLPKPEDVVSSDRIAQLREKTRGIL